MKRALPLLALTVLFLGAFLWQQSRSLAERMLDDRTGILAAAAAVNIDPELALGLVGERRVHAGPAASWPEQTRATLAEFRALRQRLGAVELALLAFAGHEATARDALERHHGDAARAAAWVRAQPEGLPVHRIQSVGRRLSRTPRA